MVSEPLAELRSGEEGEIDECRVLVTDVDPVTDDEADASDIEEWCRDPFELERWFLKWISRPTLCPLLVDAVLGCGAMAALLSDPLIPFEFMCEPGAKLEVVPRGTRGKPRPPPKTGPLPFHDEGGCDPCSFVLEFEGPLSGGSFPLGPVIATGDSVATQPPALSDSNADDEVAAAGMSRVILWCSSSIWRCSASC